MPFSTPRDDFEGSQASEVVIFGRGGKVRIPLKGEAHWQLIELLYSMIENDIIPTPEPVAQASRCDYGLDQQQRAG